MPRIRAKQPHQQRPDCTCEECSERKLIATPPQLAIPDHSGPLCSLVILIQDILPHNTNNPSIDANTYPHIQHIVSEGCNGFIVASQQQQSTDTTTPAIPCQLLRRHKETTATKTFQALTTHIISDTEQLAQPLTFGSASTSSPVVDSAILQQQPIEFADRLLTHLGFIQQPSTTAGLNGNASNGSIDMTTITNNNNSTSNGSSAQNGEHNETAAAEASTVDMVVVLLHNSTTTSSSEALLTWLDTVLGHILQTLATNTANNNLLLSVVLGMERHVDNVQFIQPQQQILPPILVLAKNKTKNNDDDGGGGGGEEEEDRLPEIVRPRQSFQFSGVNEVTVDAEQPAVITHWLPGVIRKDNVETLDAHCIQQQGAGGCILAEHVVAELAFKLGKAPKYGA